MSVDVIIDEIFAKKLLKIYMERETKLYESYSIYRSVLWKYMQKKEGFLQSTAFNARERRNFVKIGRRLLLASPFVDVRNSAEKLLLKSMRTEGTVRKKVLLNTPFFDHQKIKK